MQPLAKAESVSNQRYFQTLKGHTIDLLKILKSYIETNNDVIEQFCNRWNLNMEAFLKSLFFTVYFHDIGKLTKQFQENIKNGKRSQRYPHAFYGLFILSEIDFPTLLDVPIEKAAIMGHHTQLYSQLYSGDEDFNKPLFLEEEISSFVKNSKNIYEELEFNKRFSLNDFSIKPLPEMRKFWGILRDLRKDILTELSSFDDKEKLKSIFCYMFSILETCDDYSSAEFSDFICRCNSGDSIFDSVLNEPFKYVPRLYVDDPYETVLGGHYPYNYQKEEQGKLCGDVPSYALLFAPCGRGKTEDALIWALKALKKYHRNKIIFAMPTQITSNAMWERFCRLFDEYKFSLELKYKEFLRYGRVDNNLITIFESNKYSLSDKAIVSKLNDEKNWKIMDDALEYIIKEVNTRLNVYESGKKYVGLFHGKSFIKLKGEKEREKEGDDEDLTAEDLDEVRGENFKGNVFFKPITVTTIDHLIYSFIHGFSQADFALGNLQNAVVVFDEVHYYEKKTLEHLMTLLGLLKKMKVPHLLMSGTLPEFFIDNAKKVNKEYKGPFKDEEGLQFEPFKTETHFCEKLVAKDYINEKVMEEIKENYHKGLIQFVILNTIERSKIVYGEIINQLIQFGACLFTLPPDYEKHLIDGLVNSYIKDAFQKYSISLSDTTKITIFGEKWVIEDKNKKFLIKNDNGQLSIYDFPDVVLLHSQFTYKDRERKEKDVLYKFKEEKTRPFILVATQIVEISLDISCDIMYTEIAPVDAIGQRGGRIHRKGQTWISNKTEHAMKLFSTEELDETSLKNRPYPPDLLNKTRDIINDGPCSYLYLKNICDRVYQNYELDTRTCLKDIFKECSLFGYSPYQINFGDEEQGRLIQIRDNEFQEFDVIPWEYYVGNENNLNTENQVRVPIWWYKQDEKEYEAHHFELVHKTIGKKERPYWICKIPYNKDVGFIRGKMNEYNFSWDYII